MEELFHNQFGSVSFSVSSKIIRVQRSSQRFRTLKEIEDYFRGIAAVLERLDRKSLGILIDLREGPLRTDPEFESIVKSFQQTLVEGFSKVALLVRSAIGELQLNRQKREGWAITGIFRDEQEALSFLETPKNA